MASSGVTIVEITGLIAQLGGLAILAGTIAAGIAAVFRWYADEPLPRGLALLAGLSAVALYLNTTSALAEVITRQGGPTETQVALFNITAFAAGAAGAELGRRVGDRFETDVFLRTAGADTDDDVGRFGRALGRVVEVQLPPEIEDVVGYDPVEERTKENLAGQTFVFPRGLDAEELESRLVTRLKSDYGVGTVDVDLAADGTVDHLGVGRRAAGIGPTLPPATNAVAVQADPPFAASAGDLVQLWETKPARRVLTGELRGVAGDTVTLAIDAADTPKVDPGATYRLVTLPVEDRPDREFASLLRAADETYTSVTVAERSPIAGVPVGALSVSIAAMADADGETTGLPTQDAVIEPGTVLFAIGTPDRLRRLEVAATALSEGIRSTRRASPTSAATDASVSAAAEAGTAADSEAPADRESAAESGESAGADSETPTTGTGPGRPEAAGGEASPQGDEAAEEGGPSDGETAAASDEKPVTDEATPGATPDEADEGSTPPSFDELADAVGEERAEDPATDEDADSAGSGAGPDEPAGGSSGFADPDDADTDDDLSALSFADDAAGDDLDDLGDLSVGEDVDAGDDDLGGFENIAFGEDGAGDAEQDDSEEMAGDEDGTDDVSEGGDDDESEGGDDDESEGGDDDVSEGGDDDESEGGDDDVSDGGDDDESDGGDDDENDESNDDGGDSGDGGGGGGGGGGTFAQLKEEFESGDADWADEIDDSPGGDMRLDE